MIDRVFGNMKWMDTFAGISSKYMNPSLSDHSPIVIPCIENTSSGGRPFKFMNYLADHSSFEGIITDCWKMEDRGRPMAQVWYKLNRIDLRFCIRRSSLISHKR